MKTRLTRLIKKMTLEEKVSLTTGKDFWTTVPVERLGIPSIWLSDGPHGVRKAYSGDDAGIGGAEEATCFPTASAMASTWDTRLIEETGRALAVECLDLGVQVLLGPGLNIKRTPLGGRNFEYFSEDPYLSGEMAAAFVRGLQSMGVAASVKHFACNNQEYERMTISAEMDERTLREVYLSAFERVIKKARPWTVMASYNRINGVAATENSYLLNDILRTEWGFDGFVVSDWTAVNDKEKALAAGLDLEMPGGSAADIERIAGMVRKGLIAEEIIDRAAFRILEVVFRVIERKTSGATFDREAHHALARRVAAESIVLLKNEANLLPLDGGALSSLAVIGQFARSPRYQGAGSSQVTPTKLETAIEAISSFLKPGAKLAYAGGYSDEDTPDEALLREAAETAGSAQAAVIFAGLPPHYESEGFDRKHIDMPPAHNSLIETVCRVQPNSVVVLSNGSAVAMPWINRPKAVLEAWLGGQASGGAVAAVLFGRVNPSGKLSETFPHRLEDTPAFLNYPGEEDKVRYGEGLFVGYKYYEKKKVAPLYPFGFGLSYTSFEYVELKLSEESVSDRDDLSVSVTVKNTGARAGQEVVQLYLRDEAARLSRPLKELKGFAKMDLEPNETKTVDFVLSGRDFAYYDSVHAKWHVESGWFEVLAGSSSADIRLRSRVYLDSAQQLKTYYHRLLPAKYYLTEPAARELLRKNLADSPLVELLLTQDSDNVFLKMIADMPLIKLLKLTGGTVSEEVLDQMIDQLNRA